MGVGVQELLDALCEWNPNFMYRIARICAEPNSFAADSGTSGMR